MASSGGQDTFHGSTRLRPTLGIPYFIDQKTWAIRTGIATMRVEDVTASVGVVGPRRSHEACRLGILVLPSCQHVVLCRICMGSWGLPTARKPSLSHLTILMPLRPVEGARGLTGTT